MINVLSLYCLRSVAKQLNLAISTAGEHPRLMGMEGAEERSQTAHLIVTLENLDGDDQGILHEVVVHHSVEDVHASIITCTRENGISRMEGHASNRHVLVAKNLVRLQRQVHIKPAHSLIVGSNDQVITEWMNVHARDPLDTWLQTFV